MNHVESAEIAKMMTSSIAPVFLITGIAGILSIMSLRYGRIIDRIRTLLREGPKLYQKELGNEHLHRELRTLYRRARILRVAIITEVASIFAISLTIFAMFFSLSFGVDVMFGPQFLFIASLLCLMIGLGLFIQDYALSLDCIENDMGVRSDMNVGQEASRSMFDTLKW
ncbi:MAG: DUF2721 domain-containing protein [Chitinophagaceae bacterium]|nr:DUF2721 domain-containing protein [Oligoflexus sp.]